MKMELPRTDDRNVIVIALSLPSLTVWMLHECKAPSQPSRNMRPRRPVWQMETWPESEKGMPFTHYSEASQLKPGPLLGSFICSCAGASGGVCCPTNCSETLWEKSLRSVVLNFSSIFPQWICVMKDFLYQIAC